MGAASPRPGTARFDAVIWIFVVLSALSAFVIAAVSVGSVVQSQIAKARPAVYDIEEAVEFVAENLPDDVTAQISYDDVRQVLEWHLAYLEAKGVASEATDADLVESLVVVGDAEPIAWILGKADESEMELTDEHVAAILLAQERYFTYIGAFGPRVNSSIPDDHA